MAHSDAHCDGCGSERGDVVELKLCGACHAAADKRLADVKLRLSGDVDWDDVRKYGLYDRFGVPIATVLSIAQQRPTSMMTTSTGPTNGVIDMAAVKIITCKELKR